jgi:plastocyanin
MVPRLASAAALLATFTLAACGGGGGGSSTTRSPASASACPSGAVQIAMKDISFQPETATAKVGQKVCWTNQDDVDHDAVAKSGADFKSELFGKGKTFTATVAKAGIVSYVCTVHPAMTATLDVKP